MKFREAVTEVRRKIGIIYLNNKEDFEWLLRKDIEKNKELFDALAKL